MTSMLRGLTWDHPRGYLVLDALAKPGPGAGPGIAVRWHRQSLEDFESRPLRTLTDDYDLLVIDHPGLGEAVRDRCLRPLETLLGSGELAALRAQSAGRSFDSYRLGGHQWALPLDAAAQVSVCRPELMADRPATWVAACRAARAHRTALCLGGPHALLMFDAICVALGAPPTTEPSSEAFAEPASAEAALEIMADLFAHADPVLSQRNPIAILDAMTTAGGPAYCPLVYGYVTYQRPVPGRRALAAFNAPEGPGGIGSVLGGTGIAVTRSCTDVDSARELIRRLLSEEVQVGLYADVGGQSGDRRAWLDGEADERSGGFYSATGHTIEAAWVRPRYAGYVGFQSVASAMLREGLRDREPPAALLRRLEGLRTSLPHRAREGGAA